MLSHNQPSRFFPAKTLVVTFCLLLLASLALLSFTRGTATTSAIHNRAADSAASVKAFMQVYKVLMSPRCMNCHPAGDRPLQGDDNRIHTMNVQRGKDGKGVYALKCANCHQPTNVPGIHTPPGNPKWQLPPADMKMVFQGKTPHQLALQIMDYNQNGHKNKAQLLEHARDTLVKAGWRMGKGRVPPPLSYAAFVSVWDTWIEKGGFAPR
jgi:mono/diheme cytochrome c family protein